MASGTDLRVGYVELHCHSCFSLLDGAATPEALVERAVEAGMPALALTDHDGLYAAIRFRLAAEARGLQPILGAELTLEDDSHLLLLVENRSGYRNLCWLISRAQLNGEKGRARLMWPQFTGRTEGLMALTACRQGRVARSLLLGQPEAALSELRKLAALFGAEQVYVELQRHLHPDDEPLLSDLAELARTARLPVVATNDVHYARREGQRLQDVLVAIRHNLPLAECRPHLRPNSEYYLKSAAEMAPLFAEYPKALAATLHIAERCQLDLDLRPEAIPPNVVDAGQSPDERLTELCTPVVPRLYPRNSAAAWVQLRHELSVIRKVQLSGYFLLVWDIVRYAKERGIQVRGRGSAANSIVAYLLGITNVDPIAHRLLFERFLSTESRVMPDIDLDFCSRRREEVIQYVYQKYGEDHVGMVCNYVTYRDRSAVRDVGKALGLPEEVIDRLAKSMGHWGVGRGEAQGDAKQEALTPEALGVPAHTWEQFVSLCGEIQNYPRHLSIHVGGLCITRAPLSEVVPLERATMPGRVVIQWDKDNVEDAGLIKIDLLCLRTLSAIDECLRTIKQLHGRSIDLDRLPLDDPQVYKDLQTADTIGAFQVESRAQQQALVQMQPRCFTDIVVEVALIRPGPLQGGMVHPFFRRRQGLEPVSYFHLMLAPVLSETLGIVVFQEQVMRVAMVMGRFSAGEADLLRRAMSHHRSDVEMARFAQRFIDGAISQGVSAELATEVFQKLSGFASYGFCKSHAAAFAKTAYDTLWLRAHYPAEYYCALLNNQPMGFYAPRVLIGDAGRHGVRVLSVHINRSAAACLMEQGAIRLGLEYVAGLGEEAAERLTSVRPAKGFQDLRDLCRRSKLPRKLVENLILAGALADWDADKRRLLWELGQTRYEEETLPVDPPPDEVTLEPMGTDEELIYELAVTGVSTQGHIMELYRERLQRGGVLNSQQLRTAREGQTVRVAGLVAVRQMPATAKGFVFFTLEDEWGLMNIIVRPDVFARQREVYVGARVLAVEGGVQKAHGQINVLAEKAWKVRQDLAQW
jgi:error-prone DNA polymerase